eukprot:7407087-Lingulodinium_polyedra.AAC.1
MAVASAAMQRPAAGKAGVKRQHDSQERDPNRNAHPRTRMLLQDRDTRPQTSTQPPVPPPPAATA